MLAVFLLNLIFSSALVVLYLDIDLKSQPEHD